VVLASVVSGRRVLNLVLVAFMAGVVVGLVIAAWGP